MIAVTGGSSLSVSGSTFNYFEHAYSSIENLISVSASNSGFVFTFSLNTVACQAAYNSTKTQSMYNVIYYMTGKSFTSSSNTIYYCNTGEYGVYYLGSITTIIDSSSTYTNNSGLAGGVYYIDASSTSLTTATISSCIYYDNYGGSGGVINAANYFKMTVSACSFENNEGASGGVFYVSE